MWNERQTALRTIRRADATTQGQGRAICAAAYALHVESAMDTGKIASTLGVHGRNACQTVAAMVRAGRYLNDATPDGLFTSADIDYALHVVSAVVVANAMAILPGMAERYVARPAGRCACFACRARRANAERTARLFSHAECA